MGQGTEESPTKYQQQEPLEGTARWRRLRGAACSRGLGREVVWRHGEGPPLQKHAPTGGTEAVQTDRSDP